MQMHKQKLFNEYVQEQSLGRQLLHVPKAIRIAVLRMR